jgi:hypothetical protein
MLSPNLQSILDNRLRYLPEITAKAIASVDWAAKLATIAHHYGLHMDEVEDLQSVVMRSMVGMIQPQDFEQALISSLALSPANAEKIISEINTQIFQPIHDYVMAGGKSPDGMVGMGLHVENSEQDTPLPNPPLQGEGAEHTPTVEITNELELPEVQKTEVVEKKITPPDTFENLFFPQDTEHDAELEDIFADDEDSKVQ